MSHRFRQAARLTAVIAMACTTCMPACALKRESAHTTPTPTTTYTRDVWNSVPMPDVRSAKLYFASDTTRAGADPRSYLRVRPLGPGAEVSNVIVFEMQDEDKLVPLSIERRVYVWAHPPSIPFPEGDVEITHTPEAGTVSFPSDVQDQLSAIEGDIGALFKYSSLSMSWETKLPRTLPGSKPAGVAIILPPLGGFKYIRNVIEGLRDRGFLVMYPNGYSFRIADRKQAEAFETPIDASDRDSASPSTGAATDPPSEPPTIQDLFADLGYASEDLLLAMALQAEAALQIARKNLESVADTPTVVIGFSLGAIATPTAVARLEAQGEPVSAAVMVGGGADFARIAATSDIGLFRGEAWQSLYRTSRRDLDPLAVESLAERPFDPYHTAPLLSDRPVLVVQAKRDRIVPAATGEVLWQRLGNPERWTFPWGHGLMFWSLSRFSEDIVNWVDDAVAGRDIAEATPGQAPAGQTSTAD